MIRIGPGLIETVREAAETAYPQEACGLLIGHGVLEDGLIVSRVVPTRNVTDGDAGSSFEIDPQVHFNLLRGLRSGPDRIVGHFHSHPDHAAQPSEHDLDRAWEPDLVWVITAVDGGKAGDTRAHMIDPGTGRFREISLVAAEV